MKDGVVKGGIQSFSSLVTSLHLYSEENSRSHPLSVSISHSYLLVNSFKNEILTLSLNAVDYFYSPDTEKRNHSKRLSQRLLRVDILWCCFHVPQILQMLLCICKVIYIYICTTEYKNILFVKNWNVCFSIPSSSCSPTNLVSLWIQSCN